MVLFNLVSSIECVSIKPEWDFAKTQYSVFLVMNLVEYFIVSIRCI